MDSNFNVNENSLSEIYGSFQLNSTDNYFQDGFAINTNTTIYIVLVKNYSATDYYYIDVTHANI